MTKTGEAQGDESHGRLVLIAERELSEASKVTLKTLLENFWKREEVTWVSGLSRASVLQAGRQSGGIFYNREYLEPEQVVGLLPWREVWLVAGGNIWRLESC